MKKALLILSIVSTILAIGIFYPFSSQLTHALPNAIDPVFYAWNLSHNADTAFRGVNDRLNTNIFYPLTNTLAYSDTLWAQSIFATPIIWITHNSILAENFLTFLSFPLSSIAMFFLIYFLTGSISASFVSGLFYAFSFPRLAQFGHLPMICSQWLPLFILHLLKFLDDGKRANFFYLCLWYLLSITSSIYFGVFLLPITAVIVMADLILKIKTKTLSTYKTKIIAAIPILVVFLVALSISLFPYIRLKIENPEIKRSIDDMTHLRANFVDYISILPTGIKTIKLLPENINEHVLFPTLTISFLAILGFVTGYKKNRYYILMFMGIALISILLSLGNEQSVSIGQYSSGTIKMPYYYLYHWFPVFQIVRVPARFGIFVVISLITLASYALAAIPRKKRIFITSLCTSLFIIEIWQVNIPFVPVPLKDSIPSVYTWIEQQPEPMILAEVPVSLFYNGNPMENQLYLPYNKLSENDTYASETYRTYFSSFHKKRMINGYSGFLPDGYNKLTEILEEFPSEYSIQTLQKTGVTHIVVHLGQYDSLKKEKVQAYLTTSPLITLTYSIQNDRVYTINKYETN